MSNNQRFEEQITLPLTSDDLEKIDKIRYNNHQKRTVFLRAMINESLEEHYDTSIEVE